MTRGEIWWVDLGVPFRSEPGFKRPVIIIQDDAFKHIEAIIYSMTPKERANPTLLNGHRKSRIADGSGTSVQEVNKLLKQFEDTRKMMKMMSNPKNMMGMMKQLKGMKGGMPGM